MNLDLTDEETKALLRELDGIVDSDRYFLSPPHQDVTSDPGQDQTGAGARAPAAAEGVRAAAGYGEAAPAVKRYTGPPATLGSSAAAQARLIVWCRDCRHEVEPDPAEMAERYGADLSVPDWHKRLVCSACGSKKIDFVITGAKR
jgi:hypothetical protein